jgi:hypothetical protein
MAVKLLVLKSYEDVIADVKEMLSGDKVVGYILTNPYTTRLENTDPPSVSFYPYVPLSADKSIPIPCDWVVSIVEPLEDVKKSYMEKLNAKPENSDSEE